jgi:hypothetical protein
MAKELDVTDVHMRFWALDMWVQQNQTALLDSLTRALKDEDERVQAWALELIEQDWAREQAAKPEAER